MLLCFVLVKINAMEAMSGAGEGPRELGVNSQKAGNIQGESKEERSEDRALTEVEWTHVLIAVRDSAQDWILKV